MSACHSEGMDHSRKMPTRISGGHTGRSDVQSWLGYACRPQVATQPALYSGMHVSAQQYGGPRIEIFACLVAANNGRLEGTWRSGELRHSLHRKSTCLGVCTQKISNTEHTLVSHLNRKECSGSGIVL